MKQLLLLLLVTCGILPSFSQTQSLSANAEISILTIGPGNYLYDKFGHSAVRVMDPQSGLDVVFNYGTYDFNTPNFYSKFVQGKLLYSLSVSDFNSFYHHYKEEDRWVTEQVLNLNFTQKKNVFDLLVENSKPQNRDYLYDFTHDNCATRIRDILSLSLGDDLTYNTNLENQKSFRELIQENLHQNTWGSLGIDFALGASVDKTASKLEQQFLPNYVLEADAEAKIKQNNNWEALVKQTNNIYEQQKAKKETGFFLFSPWVIFSLLGLGLIAISFRDVVRKKRTKSVDIAVFTITSVLGLFIAFMWFATDHTATKLNYNILWAFPIGLFFIRSISKNVYSRRLVHYLNLVSILIFLVFLHWITGVQEFAYPLIGLLIGLLIRYRYLARFYKNILKEEQLND